MERVIRGKLSLKVIQARLTRDTEFFGKMNPYCVVKLGDFKTQTNTHKSGGKFPSWSNEFMLSVETDDSLIAEVWNTGLLNDDLVGTATVDLRLAFRDANEVADWYEIIFKGRKAGLIRLEMKLEAMTSYYGGMASEQMPTPRISRSVVEDLAHSVSGSLGRILTGNTSYPANTNYPAPTFPAPGYPAPTYAAPTYTAPTSPAPGYPAPTYAAPTSAAPGYPAPTYPQYPAPAYSAPTYAAPMHYAPHAGPQYVAPGPSYTQYHPSVQHLVYQHLPPSVYQAPQYPPTQSSYPSGPYHPANPYASPHPPPANPN
jgi:hypothetical protein